MAPGLVVLVLALLLGLQPVTTDLYLPALPALTEGFGAPMGQAQLTLTALLLAFGISQLVWGPLSDRFGRRPILLWGLGAYVVASIAAAWAPSMALLIVWRTVQGVAMGAAVMCARALVRDLYQPLDGARVMSKGLSGLGVIACLSAPLGGVISDAFGWRAALLALSVAGAATLALIAWRFEETLAERNPRALQPGTLLRTWAGILRHPTFLSYALLATASYGGLFTFLAASSFVFIGLLGLSKTSYGLVMFANSFVYILGTMACRRLLPHLGVRRTVGLAAFCTLGAGMLLVGLHLAGVRNLWALLVPSCLYMLGHGVHQPCGQSGAVGPFPQAAGAASAMSGFLMMVGAFGTGAWLGATLRTGPDASAWPLVLGMAFWCAVIAGTAWTLVQRFGDGRAGPQRVSS